MDYQKHAKRAILKIVLNNFNIFLNIFLNYKNKIYLYLYMEEYIKLPTLNVSKSSNYENNESMNLNNLTSNNNDLLYRDLRTVQSMQKGAYDISNYSPDEEGEKMVRKIQLNEPTVNFNGCHAGGKNGIYIDKDSDLKFMEMTNKKYINQLFTRLTLTAPYVRGQYDVDVESVLKPGDKTDINKSCNGLSDKSLIDYYYTPLINKIKNEVQNSKYLIEQDSDNEWIRGGMSTRQEMRNLDYQNKINSNISNNRNFNNNMNY